MKHNGKDKRRAGKIVADGKHKNRRKKSGSLHNRFNPIRQPLLVQEDAPTPLVDYGLANSAILRQIGMLDRVLFRLSPEVRDKAVKVLDAGMDFPNVEIQIKAASGIAKLATVNANILKMVAGDQFQRHLTFEQRESEEVKEKALDQMSEQELEALENLSRRQGGVIEVPDAAA